MNAINNGNPLEFFINMQGVLLFIIMHYTFVNAFFIMFNNAETVSSQQVFYFICCVNVIPDRKLPFIVVKSPFSAKG